jgi:hypothetical protein
MFKRAIAVFFVLAVAGLSVAIFVVPDLMNAMLKTTVLEYGDLSISDTVTAYIVRDETVYVAARSGEIRYYVGEGVKVRKDVKLLDIIGGKASAPPTAAGEDGAAPLEAGAEEMAALRDRVGAAGVTQERNEASGTGVVSYYIDGHETTFSFENIPSLTRRTAAEADGHVVNVTRHGGYVTLGEPIYKLTDNTQWRMVFWFDKSSGSVVNYKSGESVTVGMDGGGNVAGRIEDVVDQGDAWMVTLYFDRYYESMARVRSVTATVAVADYRGLLIDNGDMTARDGVIGVYARQKNGDFKFVPVNVLRSDGSRSIISMSSFTAPDGKEVKTVNIYEEILRDPEGYEP